MLKSLIRDTKLILLLVLAVFLKAFSTQPHWVEHYYTYGIYLYIAKVMRTLFGWLPFSVGDLLYAAAGIYLLYGCRQLAVWIKKDGLKTSVISTTLYRILKTALLVYILFNALWGLNYNRLGIAYQLGLDVRPYALSDVHALTLDLQQKLNYYAARVDTVQRAALNENKSLFMAGIATYHNASKAYPYLQYAVYSIKPSLYTSVGHYFGFTGYYNPFSGEAQLKTTIPVFIKPFVTAHEIAHQVGYAKENEANFIAFLAGRHSADVNVLYSLYYEMYRYALREVYSRDTLLGAGFKGKLHPRVITDNEVLKQYFLKTANKIEPLISVFYDRFLKLNNQKEGVQTYNRVVALLVAYRKKYGAVSI